MNHANTAKRHTSTRKSRTRPTSEATKKTCLRLRSSAWIS